MAKTIQLRCMRCGAKFLGPTVESIVEINDLKPFKNDFWKCDCKNFLGMNKKKKDKKFKGSVSDLQKEIKKNYGI